jgi:hypothetical protein
MSKYTTNPTKEESKNITAGKNLGHLPFFKCLNVLVHGCPYEDTISYAIK